MNEKEILAFKTTIDNYSVDELLAARTELQSKLSQMILESDVIMKVAIIENQLKEKLNKETDDGKIE